MTMTTIRLPNPLDLDTARDTTTALAAVTVDDTAYFSAIDERVAYLDAHPSAVPFNLDRSTGQWHEVTRLAFGETPNASLAFDMLKVADLMRAKGVNAYTEQTGGGCATIFAGPAPDDRAPEAQWTRVAYDRDGRRPMAAGPGSWWTHAEARGFYGEFVWGPDDDGESPTWETLPFDPTLTEAMIADRLVEWYRAHVDEAAWLARVAEENSDLLDPAERDALGLDDHDYRRFPHRERDLDDRERVRLTAYRASTR
jgi:hypothetical protein